jgi:argonaute-like protein implicated in RNA metabolism and viral defense
MMQVNYMNNLHRNFREVYSGILNDKEASKILAKERGVNATSLKRDYLGSFLINQASEAYRLYKNSLIPADLWETISQDMKDLFKWGFISVRWEEVKKYHSVDFQNFVDLTLLDSQNS